MPFLLALGLFSLKCETIKGDVSEMLVTDIYDCFFGVVYFWALFTCG